MKWFKDNWLIVVLIAAVIFLLLRPVVCNKPTSHVDDKKEVDSIAAALKNENYLLTETLDSIATSNDTLKEKVSSREARIGILQNKLNSTLAQLKSHQNKISFSLDTSEIVSNCDSLGSKFADYVDMSQAIISGKDSIIADKDKIISNLDSANTLLVKSNEKKDAAIDTITKKYDALYIDFSKGQKRSKLHKAIDKGLQGLALALAAALIIK